MNEIRCPKCDRSMMEGFVVDRTYGGALRQAWVEGEPEKSFWTGLKIKDKTVFAVTAFRCADCRYLEFYTAEKIDI